MLFPPGPFHQKAIKHCVQAFGEGRVHNVTFNSRKEYKDWLNGNAGALARLKRMDERAEMHTSSPFVWLDAHDDKELFVGGCDNTLAFITSLTREAAQRNAADQQSTAERTLEIEPSTCLYTVTRDHDFVIDWVPGHQGSNTLIVCINNCQFDCRTTVLTVPRHVIQVKFLPLVVSVVRASSIRL